MQTTPPWINATPAQGVQLMEPDPKRVSRNIGIWSLVAAFSALATPYMQVWFETWMFDPFNSYWLERDDLYQGANFIFGVLASLVMIACGILGFKGSGQQGRLVAPKTIRRLCMLAILFSLLTLVEMPGTADKLVWEWSSGSGEPGSREYGARLEIWHPHVGYILTPLLMLIPLIKARHLPMPDIGMGVQLGYVPTTPVTTMVPQQQMAPMPRQPQNEM